MALNHKFYDKNDLLQLENMKLKEDKIKYKTKYINLKNQLIKNKNIYSNLNDNQSNLLLKIKNNHTGGSAASFGRLISTTVYLSRTPGLPEIVEVTCMIICCMSGGDVFVADFLMYLSKSFFCF